MVNKRVLLGMSGGTDSSVSAMLLLEEKYELVGITLRLWSESDPTGNAIEPAYLSNARTLANKLHIEHYVIDVRELFYQQIISYFINGYAEGRTPNPCAKCNPLFKWKVLNELSDTYNCQYIATGHYVGTEKHNGYTYISKGRDFEKEQSFFLWGLDQPILTKAVFPLSNLTKTQIKEFALSRGFEQVSKLKESMGICFINGLDYRPFLIQMLKDKGITINKGQFVDKEGNFIGWHKGYPYYTVGQRHGLGLVPDTPWYVIRIVPEQNTIVLGKYSDLYHDQIQVTDYRVINQADFIQPVDVRIRYRKQNAKGSVRFLNESKAVVDLLEPEWSIAPGQTVAFYQQNRLLGGGFIEG
jgi:tRNA-uridine 2-sulfurtransferase